MTASTEEVSQSFLYGRVASDNGATYQGRLRFGGDEEAFWGNYFNGVKDEKPWATHAPLERLTEERRLGIFGFEISLGERQVDLGRPLMARFGDIARIEARGRDLWVTLKSGTVFHLDRFAADDFADGLRCGTLRAASWTSTNGGSAPSSFSPTPHRKPRPPSCTVRYARRRPPLRPGAGLLGRLRAHRLQRRRQRARLQRFPAGPPADRKRHHSVMYPPLGGR